MTGLTITSNLAAGKSLDSTTFNPVSVATGVTITNVNLPALYTEQTTYWSIVNSGTLLATGTSYKSVDADGILLFSSGGAVTNTTSGSITGYQVGVSVAGIGTVVNQGTIRTTGTFRTTGTAAQSFTISGGAFTAFSAGVLMAGGGVSNAAGGLIAGYYEGVALGGGGSVVNAGTIFAPAANDGFGVVLTAGGSVTNAQGGRISGGSDGVLTFGDADTVINQGYIAGSDGVAMATGGSLSNASTGIIYGFSAGVQFYAAQTVTVTNAAGGTIAGGRYGVFVYGRNAGTVMNAGLIDGEAVVGAVLLKGGVLDNQTLGRIAGGVDGVYTGGSIASTIINDGAVYGFGYTGILMRGAGSVTNSGSVSGQSFGILFSNDPGTVVNAGTISSSAVYPANHSAFFSAGVQLADGGVVTNSAGGVIRSEWMGVQIGSTTTSVGGTVINQGTILAADVRGDGAGVWIHGPGAITNAVGGLISGGGFGIVAYYQITVVNRGTVFGTGDAFDAVNPGFADRIIDLPGGVFSGVVDGGNTVGSAIYSTLELASGSSTGTIVNIGTFTDFGRIALDADATWSLGGTFAAGETVAFGGTHADLILASPSAAPGAIMAGFTTTDTITLSGITDVTKLTFDGDTLVVSESGSPGLELQFAAPLDLTYNVVGDATDIALVPCFLPGTHILTDNGEVLVEKLRVGDTIVTLGGRTRRLCWIGHGRALATRGQRGASTPVIVRKGALRDNVPDRDLHITKGHALYLDGVLIPVEFLINHRNVLWDDRAQEVTVFHLELDAHDVLIANGAAAESYRDDGNRWLFQNANEGWDQPPKPACAPVLTGGAVVDAVWRRILDRAGCRPGLPLTDDPDLHLLVDGVRVDAVERQGPVHVFRLGGQPRGVCIASREVVPAELGLARDPRSLGVALRRVAVRQGTRFVVLKADDVRLLDGFHPYEAAADLRWTDGRAGLPAEVFAGFGGSVEIAVHVAATTRYPHEGAVAA